MSFSESFFETIIITRKEVEFNKKMNVFDNKLNMKVCQML